MNRKQRLLQLHLEKGKRIFPNRLASVILAAGRSTRLGRPKALLEVHRGWPAWLRILTQHLTCGFAVRLVASPELASHLREQGVPSSILRTNIDPEQGPLSSLLLGLEDSLGASGLLVHAVDHPLASAQTLRRLEESHRETPDTICIPSAHGMKGHPVVFPSRFFLDLLRAPLQCGARSVVRQRASATRHIPVEDEGVCANLNTEADLRHWRRHGYFLRWSSARSEVTSQPDDR